MQVTPVESPKNVKFTKQQRMYIAEIMTKCWGDCHNEHCHGSHDCKHDIHGLIDKLIKFGLNDSEIHASLLGIKL